MSDALIDQFLLLTAVSLLAWWVTSLADRVKALEESAHRPLSHPDAPPRLSRPASPPEKQG